MKPVSTTLCKLLLAGAVSTGSAVAGASTSYAKIDSVDFSYETYAPPPPGASIDWLGKSILLKVSDTYQYLTYYSNRYDPGTSGFFKTATVTDLIYPSLVDTLYSSDGVHFAYSYGGTTFEGTGHYSAILDGHTWNFTSTGWDYEGSWNINYVATLPVPAAAWLFGSALLGLGARRKLTTQA